MEAEAILRFALYKEVLKRQRKKKRVLHGANDHEADAESGEDESEDEEQPARMATPQQPVTEKGKEPARVPDLDPVWGAGSQDVEMDEASATLAGLTEEGAVRPGR